MKTAADPRPLAARMRPRNLAEFVGQGHLLDPSGPIAAMLRSGKLHSMMFWGPPGSGKTTLARLLAEATHSVLQPLSAVNSGVRE
ncbi:MAG: AAA family ATPase, partial [Acidithiobacillus sp.]